MGLREERTERKPSLAAYSNGKEGGSWRLEGAMHKRKSSLNNLTLLFWRWENLGS